MTHDQSPPAPGPTHGEGQTTDEDSQPATGDPRASSMFSVLRNRDFARLAGAHAISQVGTGVTDLALPLIGEGDCDACIHYVLGDCNGDGNVNTFDIDPFVFALTDPTGYIAQYGEQAYYCQCDITEDGNVNTFDIDPFVALLTSAP